MSLLKKSRLRPLKNLKILVLLLVLFCLAPVQALEKVTIGDVKLKGTVLNIPHDSFADLKFKKRIYDNPPRLVFDILGAELGNRVINYELPERFGLTQVRVAQFDKETVRVVTEGTSVTALEKIRIENIGRVLYFKFGLGNIKLSDIAFEEGSLRVVGEGPITPRTILLDNPQRLVVDLIGAELKSPAQAKRFVNGDEDIKVTQFDDSIVRIVFTGKKSHARDVRISTNERQLIVLGEGGKPPPEEQPTIGKLLAFKVLKSSPDETVFVLESKSEMNYKFLKLHNPERLVVDLVDINFDESLAAETIPETPHVKSARFGLATLGRPVTRIVFDLKTAGLLEEFKESPDKKTLHIRMQGLSPDKVTKAAETVNAAQKSMGARVVLDAGHGGYDHGAIYGGHNEKDITLQIANRVQEYLKTAGIDTYMTRSEDRFISLAERVELSNSIEPKIFVSIHVNALITNTNMQGLQTYYYSNGGLKLAEYLHKQLLKDVGMPDQRIRKANFWVCKYTEDPSILLELGFMTNVEERNKLTRDSYQAELAKAVARGIIEYLEEN